MDWRKFGQVSNLIRFKLVDKTTGQGKTGLTGSTAGLIISTIADNEATATIYTQAASHIQTIATLGTYAAPSASNCRFGQVDATNNPGLYELQIADARFAVTNSKKLVISVNDAEATILDTDYEIILTQVDPFDAVRFALTALPNVAAEGAGGLYTRGSGAGQINQDANGRIDSNVKAIVASTNAATRLEKMFAATQDGTVDTATFSPTTTVFETSFTVNTDFFTKQAILWVSGANAGITNQISVYNYSVNNKVKLTVNPALPSAPANTDEFLVLGKIGI